MVQNKSIPSALKRLHLDFYRKTQASLETLGFVVVADIEDRTISSAGSVVTFIRLTPNGADAPLDRWTSLNPSDNRKWIAGVELRRGKKALR